MIFTPFDLPEEPEVKKIIATSFFLNFNLGNLLIGLACLISSNKRILIPFPLQLAKISAKLFEIMPRPLLTLDQLRLLKYDNIPSGKYKTNFQIGVPSVRNFDDEIKKYSFMWREGGQFSTEKYLSSKNLDNNSNSN